MVLKAGMQITKKITRRSYELLTLPVSISLLKTVFAINNDLICLLQASCVYFATKIVKACW